MGMLGTPQTTAAPTFDADDELQHLVSDWIYTKSHGLVSILRPASSTSHIVAP